MMRLVLNFFKLGKSFSTRKYKKTHTKIKEYPTRKLKTQEEKSTPPVKDIK
jgi:hypothetical protein